MNSLLLTRSTLINIEGGYPPCMTPCTPHPPESIIGGQEPTEERTGTEEDEVGDGHTHCGQEHW